MSGGQAIGGIAAGLIFDLSDSYNGTFPMFTVAALIGVLLITRISQRFPTKCVGDFSIETAVGRRRRSWGHWGGSRRS